MAIYDAKKGNVWEKIKTKYFVPLIYLLTASKNIEAWSVTSDVFLSKIFMLAKNSGLESYVYKYEHNQW